MSEDLRFPVGRFETPAAIDEPLWRRPYRHPELGLVSLEKALALYAWHGRHHVAQITRLRERNGWS